MVSRLTYPTCRIGYEWNIRRWTSYARKQHKRMIFLTSKSLALDRHAKQYEALFSGGTVNSSWCRMPQHSKLNFAIKHKAWHYIDNIQNKLLSFTSGFGWKTTIQSRPNIMSWSEDHMVSRLTYPTCRIGYEWNIRRWTSYARKQHKRMIFLTSKSLALDRHAKQYEALFSGGTVNSSWCRMPQHSKLNFAIKHKAWHYIDNIQNKLLKYLT